MDLSFFVKSITIDDENRIVVIAQDIIKDQLSNAEYRKQARQTLKDFLKEDFIELEVSSSSARVTVSEGKAEECKNIIETELNKVLEMAAQFMGGMNM